VPFAPELTLPALLALRAAYGARLFSTYGFLDAFNPTFTATTVSVERGSVDPTSGWVDSDYLGIDEGARVAMLENYRSGFICSTMHRSSYFVRGLRRAGFRGGWLAQAP